MAQSAGRHKKNILWEIGIDYSFWLQLTESQETLDFITLGNKIITQRFFSPGLKLSTPDSVPVAIAYKGKNCKGGSLWALHSEARVPCGENFHNSVQ